MLSAHVVERRAAEALVVGTIEIVLCRRRSEIRLFANGRRDLLVLFLGLLSGIVILFCSGGILWSLNELRERRLMEI